MQERLTKAYDAVKATEAQRRAAQSAAMQVLQKTKPQVVRAVRWASAVAAVLVLTVLGAVGYQLYMQPVAVVSIAGETATELQINRFDKVVAIETEIDDAIASDLRFTSYRAAVETLAGGTDAQVTVFSRDPARCEAVCRNLQEQCDSVCRIGDTAVMQQAAEQGLPCGKYAAFLEWQALDETVTVEQVRDMTMREIRARIAALNTSESEDAADVDCGTVRQHGNGQGDQNRQEQGQGNASQHGQGHAQGEGNQHGQGKGQGNGQGHRYGSHKK